MTKQKKLTVAEWTMTALRTRPPDPDHPWWLDVKSFRGILPSTPTPPDAFFDELKQICDMDLKSGPWPRGMQTYVVGLPIECDGDLPREEGKALMAPQPDTPRLSSIDPEQLADAVFAGVKEHAVWVAGVVGLELTDDVDNYRHRWCQFGGEVDNGDGMPFGMLRENVRRLAAYAKGDEFWDDIDESVQIVSRSVWGRAGDENVSKPEEANPDALSNDWRGRLLLVVRGAAARARLDRGEDISPADLGILAGKSPDHIRLMCRQGRIACLRLGPNRWLISADTAKEYFTQGGDSR